MYWTESDFPSNKRTIQTQLLIVGGGVAGCVAAVAAAREGIKTVLLQNRPVLGGVSSSEYGEGNGLCVNGAANYVHRDAKECGILEEMKNENSYRNTNGMQDCWSWVLRYFLEQEENITLMMNTEALDVTMKDARIESVHARGINREIDYTIHADYFIDASGDGVLAASGADFRMGREARSEFNESMAPDQADHKIMGSSIAFKAHDAGHPVSFKAPKGIVHFQSDADLPFRDHSSLKHGYWWLEYGGEINTIQDNEKIYSMLKNVLFGIWDHVKNGGDHGADNYVIDWISPICGKRESRRFIGDVMLNLNDIVEDRDWPDAVAYGGWPVDIHPPEGIFGHGHPGSEPPFLFPPTYTIPFRALYSRNVPNLLLAGRDISVTHVALGTTRVMATCALCGQAVGTAVSLLEKYHCPPAELYKQHLTELRSLLQKNDLTLPGHAVTIPDDLARNAVISASSEWHSQMLTPDAEESLTWEPKDGSDPCDLPPDDRRRAQIFFLPKGEYQHIVLLLSNTTTAAQNVTAHLRRENQDQDLAVSAIQVQPGEKQQIAFFNDLSLENGHYLLILDPVEGIMIYTSKVHLPGFHRRLDGCYANLNNFVMQMVPAPVLYPVSGLHNDFGRPSNESPNIWISESGLPQTVTLQWKSPVTFNTIDLIFDTNLDLARTLDIAPECIKSYTLSWLQNGIEHELYSETDNYRRFNRLTFEAITASCIKLKLLLTHGDAFARLYGIRVYDNIPKSVTSDKTGC